MPEDPLGLEKYLDPPKPVRGRTFDVQFPGDPSQWNLGRLKEVEARFQRKFGKPMQYGRKGQGTGVGGWEHHNYADVGYDPGTPESDFIQATLRELNIPFQSTSRKGVQRNAQGRIISTDAHTHIGSAGPRARQIAQPEDPMGLEKYLDPVQPSAAPIQSPVTLMSAPINSSTPKDVVPNLSLVQSAPRRTQPRRTRREVVTQVLNDANRLNQMLVRGLQRPSSGLFNRIARPQVSVADVRRADDTNTRPIGMGDVQAVNREDENLHQQIRQEVVNRNTVRTGSVDVQPRSEVVEEATNRLFNEAKHEQNEMDAFVRSLTPNERARLIGFVEGHRNLGALRSLTEGMQQSAGSTVRKLGTLLESPLDEAIRQSGGGDSFAQSLKRSGKLAELASLISRQEHPEEGWASLRDALLRGAGSASIDVPLMLGTGKVLGGATLPALGALEGADRGEALKGALEGVLMHKGMGATANWGRVANAAVWTTLPTVKSMAEGQSFTEALGEALPFGALAAAGRGVTIRERALRQAGFEPTVIRTEDGRTASVYVHPEKQIFVSRRIKNEEARPDRPVAVVSERVFNEVTRNGKLGGITGGRVNYRRVENSEAGTTPAPRGIAPQPRQITGRVEPLDASEVPPASPRSLPPSPNAEPWMRPQRVERPVVDDYRIEEQGGKVYVVTPQNVPDVKSYPATQAGRAQAIERLRTLAEKEQPKIVRMGATIGERMAAQGQVPLTDLSPETGLGVETPSAVPVQPQGESAPTAPTVETKAVIRHADPRIDGGEIVGRTNDGKLKVANNEGGISVVQNPRTRGNRNATIQKVSNEVASEVVSEEVGQANTTRQNAAPQGNDRRALFDTEGNRVTPEPAPVRVNVEGSGEAKAPAASSVAPSVEGKQPVPAGHTRFFRADSFDAAGPQGKGWVTDPEYASQKYGKGQMGSESLWYIDIPDKAFESAGDAVPSLLDSGTLKAYGIKPEPKLYRRVQSQGQKEQQVPRVVPAEDLTRSIAPESSVEANTRVSATPAIPEQESEELTPSQIGALRAEYDTLAPEVLKPDGTPKVRPNNKALARLREIVDVVERHKQAVKARQEAEAREAAESAKDEEVARLEATGIRVGNEVYAVTPRGRERVQLLGVEGEPASYSTSRPQAIYRMKVLRSGRETRLPASGQLRLEPAEAPEANLQGELSAARSSGGMETSFVRNRVALPSNAGAGAADAEDNQAEVEVGPHGRFTHLLHKSFTHPKTGEVLPAFLSESSVRRTLGLPEVSSEVAKSSAETQKVREAIAQRMRTPRSSYLGPNGFKRFIELHRDKLSDDAIDAYHATILEHENYGRKLDSFLTHPEVDRILSEARNGQIQRGAKTRLAQIAKQFGVSKTSADLALESARPREDKTGDVERGGAGEAGADKKPGPDNQGEDRSVELKKRALLGQLRARVITRTEYDRRTAELFLPKESAPLVRRDPRRGEAGFINISSLLIGKRNTPILEVVTALRRAGLLSSIKMHARNLASNTSFAISEEFARPFAALADIAMKSKTGYRTKQGASPASVARAVFGRQGAIIKGTQDAWNVLWFGTDRAAESKYQLERVQSGLPILDAYIQLVMNSVQASDKWAKAYAIKRELDSLAVSEARNEHAQNPRIDVGKRAKELRLSPTEAMQREAVVYAEIATFQNDNPISSGISAIKKVISDPEIIRRVPGAGRYADSIARMGRGGKFLFEQIIPFDRTPTNVFLRILEHTPVGIPVSIYKYKQVGRSKDRLALSQSEAEQREKFDRRLSGVRGREDRRLADAREREVQKLQDAFNRMVEGLEAKNGERGMSLEEYRAIDKAKRGLDSLISAINRTAIEDDAQIKRAREFADKQTKEVRAAADKLADELFTKEEQRRFAETVGRAGLGTTIGALTLVLLAKGLMDTSGVVDYADEKGRAMANRAAGVRDCSVRIPGTDIRINISGNPLGNAICAEVTSYEQASRPGTFTEKAKATGKGLLEVAKQQPLIQDALDQRRDERTAEERGANYVSSFIPRVLSEAAEVVDDQPRKYWGQGVAAQFQRFVPPRVLPKDWKADRDALPVSENPIGGIEERGDWLRRAIRTIDPFEVTTQRGETPEPINPLSRAKKRPAGVSRTPPRLAIK